MKTRSTLAGRLAVGGAVAVLSIGLTAPNAVGQPPEEKHEPKGQSAEHRQDGNAPGHAADATQPSSSTSTTDESSSASATTGDLSSPQPPSNADFTGNGANDHGAYDSTRDGSPSANGNGDGAAVGRPCAGCVGKADNKNPPGQFPDGTDANNGYECDGNQGIGKTNPAHTGCVTIRSSTTPKTDVVVKSAVTPTPQPTEVLGVSFLAAPSPAPAATPPPAAAVAPATLAVTGAGTTVSSLGSIGVALLVVGVLLVRKPKRRRPRV